MPIIEDAIPVHLAEEAEAARAWFVQQQASPFEVTGIVDPQSVGERDPATQGRVLQLILCGQRDGQDVCLRKRFELRASGSGFDVNHLPEPAPEIGSPAPRLDPPAGSRDGWLDHALAQHAFVVLLFYRGFW